MRYLVIVSRKVILHERDSALGGSGYLLIFRPGGGGDRVLMDEVNCDRDEDYFDGSFWKK